MEMSHLTQLPDELLEAIVSFLLPEDTVAFGRTSQRHHKFTQEPLLWRRYCSEGWQYWSTEHDLATKLAAPPAQTRWKRLFNDRVKADRDALRDFDEMLTTQQYRLARMEHLASHDYNALDMLLKLRDQTPEDAEDVLARRFHAAAIVDAIYRSEAVKIWLRVQEEKPVPLEEALFSFDMFVMSGEYGSVQDLQRELDSIAQHITLIPNFNQFSTRRKAVVVASHLRQQDLVGNPVIEQYHALRNNFISMAVLDGNHASLPLQSAVIYCAIARRLRINAAPSGFPNHVYVIVEAPDNLTLDGADRNAGHTYRDLTMYMDPWRSSQEVDRSILHRTLNQIGIARNAYDIHLQAASTKEVVLRVGRNLMHSVSQHRSTSRVSQTPSRDRAWYAALWVDTLLDGDMFHLRGGGLPYLMRHHTDNHPEDIGLIEKYIVPKFEYIHPRIAGLSDAVEASRKADANKRPVNARDEHSLHVQYKIGTYFSHRRYGYLAVIIRWDNTCLAGEDWMHRMRVHDLAGGREQPFYQVFVAEDKTTRYVAEENILELHDEPIPEMLAAAGRWHKRWDNDKKVFISNIRDEFPDD